MHEKIMEFDILKKNLENHDISKIWIMETHAMRGDIIT